VRRGPDSVIIAWVGKQPVYASPQLLRWRARMAELRQRIESLLDGSAERDDAWAEYYRVMAE